MLHEEQLKALPARPGVYLLKDERGTVLYVGKASSLRHRVRAYFGPRPSLSPKLRKLVSRIADVDFLVTDSEQEALLLENNLIKSHRPRYNVRLKDDKTYPYLKIDLKEPWPRVYITRRWEQDGSRYFGPFASASSVRRTLDVLKKLFPFRSCTRTITGTDRRACIEYDIHRCLGPCLGRVTPGEYSGVMRQVVLFLEGRDRRVVRKLRRRMEAAAENLDFERAARLRDQIQAVEKVTERQKIASPNLGDFDAIAFAQARDLAYVEVFFIRQGKLLGREAFTLEGAQDEHPSRIMSSFVPLFYGSAPYIPPLILLQHPVEDGELVAGFLHSLRGGRVRLGVPRRGEKRALVDLVAENARQGLEQLRVRQLSAPDALATALEDIREGLNLSRLPQRMECYDVSNIQGAWAVGSMVVFESGRPKSSHYRRFRIRTVSGADDYAMLQEVLRRRFRRGRGDDSSGPWGITPDLVLIDGGRGQLSAALEAMMELGVDVPTAALAKENEEVYTPESSEPILLPRQSTGLFLLQRLRDEAHRFALSYHQRVRRREGMGSALDSVPGIGPKRKRALLRRFGSVRALREAPIEEVAAVAGMTRRLAQQVKGWL
ncbi:MAG: excinuclease ABC subunit UvrC [Dehalococcoidia bacterium]